MPTKKKVEEESEIAVATAPNGDIVVAESKSGKTEFHIYNGEEFVRTYSVEEFGDQAEELAKEYVSHNPGEIR